MSKAHSRCHDIYRRLLEDCPPHVLPAPYQQLGGDEDARVSPPDIAATLSQLVNRFGARDLVDAGVARAGEGGQLQVHPALADPGAPLLPLRDTLRDRIFEILTPAGGLRGSALPALAALGDRTTRSALGRDPAMYLTFNLEDTLAFRAIGLAAAPASGLDGLGGADLKAFVGRFDLGAMMSTECGRDRDRAAYGPGDEEGCDAEIGLIPRPLFLTLVAWSPSQLSLATPPGVTAVVEHLGKLEQFMGLSMDEVIRWTVSAADRDRLAFCLEHGDCADVRQAVEQSVADSARPLVDPGSAALPTYVSARAELRAALRHHRSPHDRDMARRAASEAAERELVQPILEDATKSGDPLRRNLLTSVAEMFRITHLLARQIEESLATPSSGSPQPAPASRAQVKQLLELVQGLARTVGALKN